MVEEKQLLIILPFLDPLSFETRKRINNCTRNQLHFCSLRIAFQSKTCLSSYFNSKTVFLYTFTRILFITFCIVAATQLIMVKLRHLFVRLSENLGTTPMTQKWVKNHKKSATMDHTLLEGHNSTYNDFLILTLKSCEFKLHLNKSLLIKRDKLEFNRNIYIHFLHVFSK